MNASFTLHSGWEPAKKMALSLSMAVKVKWAHGGGLSPVITGDDHSPGKQRDQVKVTDR